MAYSINNPPPTVASLRYVLREGERERERVDVSIDIFVMTHSYFRLVVLNRGRRCCMAHSVASSATQYKCTTLFNSIAIDAIHSAAFSFSSSVFRLSRIVAAAVTATAAAPVYGTLACSKAKRARRRAQTFFPLLSAPLRR